MGFNAALSILVELPTTLRCFGGGFGGGRSAPQEAQPDILPMDDHINKHLASLKSLSARPHLLPAGVEPFVPEKTRLGKAGSFIRTHWDRGSFIFLPKLATPSIVIGCLLGSLGLLLCGSALFQERIPFMEKLFGDSSLSLMLSMVLMRTGLHLVDSGVRFSRTKERTRHDTLKQYRLFAIKYLNDRNSVDVTSEMIEIQRMDNRMDPAMRILDPTISDPTKRIQAFIKKPLEALRADLNEKYTVHKGRWANWYNFWERDGQPVIGKLDIGLGILMLNVAFLALGMSLATNWVDADKFPSTFKLIVQDPFLTTSFAFILIANAITCIKIGTQMTGYGKRNGKRKEITDDLKQIQRGLEGKSFRLKKKKRVKKKPVAPPPQPPSILKRFWRHLTPPIVPLGKHLTHILAPISIVVGVILLGLGFFYMAISSGRPIPRRLEFLAANSRITLPFATGTIISGFHAIYRGISLREKKMKGEWKEVSIKTREALFSLLSKAPSLQEPGANRAPQIPAFVIPRMTRKEKRAHEKLVAAALKEKEADKKYRSWLNSFLWLPDGMAGGVLLYCGVAVILTLAGAIRSPHEMLSNKSSFASALIFSVGLIAVSVDAFLCAYRIGTYNNRKREDSQFVEDLQHVLRHQLDLRKRYKLSLRA